MDAGIVAIIVAVINSGVLVINTIINNKNSKKVEVSEKTSLEIKKAVGDLSKELNTKIDENAKVQAKRFVIQFMDKAEAGQQISREEMEVAYEAKQEYNDKGGNSYVDTKWKYLEDKDYIKLVG